MATHIDRRNTWRRIAERCRTIPGRFGLRTWRVFVRRTMRSGAFGLEGAESFAEVELTNAGWPVKVRSPNDREIGLGVMAIGDLRVGPITPEHPVGGGMTIGTLTEADPDEMLHFRVVSPQHPEGAMYRLQEAQTDRAIHYTLILSPVASDQPT